MSEMNELLKLLREKGAELKESSEFDARGSSEIFSWDV